MSPLYNRLAIGAVVLGVLVATVLPGASDTEAAQAVADDHKGAALLAEQAAACQRRFGADVEVFVLENQHTVCRLPKSFTTEVRP